MSAKRTAIAAALVFAAGLAIAHTATDGFEAYTLESARRLQALRSPAAVPDFALDLADGGRVLLSEMRSRVLLVDFVYTSCPTYCLALGSVSAQLQQRLAPEIASGDVRLLSITFDPGRDGHNELRRGVQKLSRGPVESETALFKRGEPSRSILFGMVASCFPLQYLIAALGLWLNRQQQDVIDYLKEENQLLKAKLGDRRIQFTDAERCRLAVRAKALGRKLLSQLDNLVTPNTLLRWHRQLVAQKWNYVHRRSVGRPRIKGEIAALILRMTEENPGWGYTRILGALRNLGHEVSRGTIANVLRENGLDPAALRGKHTKWSTFLKAHWKSLVASDFFNVEVWRLRGLTTHYVLFFIQLATRTVKIAGLTTHPDTAWMIQMGRNITDSESGMLVGKRTLIIDRDTKYCEDFRHLLEQSGTAVIRLPPRSPDLNANAERFVRSIKEECVQRLIFFGEASLRHALSEYMAHYHQERNQQGMNNRLLNSAANDDSYSTGVASKRARLGGVLNYYYGEAA